LAQAIGLSVGSLLAQRERARESLVHKEDAADFPCNLLPPYTSACRC